MTEINQTDRAAYLLNRTVELCKEYRHEFVMPEHLLFALTDDSNFRSAFNMFYDPFALIDKPRNFLNNVETLPQAEKTSA